MSSNDYPFVPSDVAMYRRLRPHADSVLDDQTWDDMLLQQYSDRLAPGVSIFGRQELHRRLYAAQPDSVSVSRVQALVDDEGLRRRLQFACADLRRSDHEVSETLYGPAITPQPRWTVLLPWLPIAFLLSGVLGLTTGWLPWWGVVLALWMVLMMVQMRYHEDVQTWRRILSSVQLMLRAHALLARLDEAFTASLREDAAQAGKLNRRMNRSIFANMPAVADYADWLWLQNVRHYFHSREVVRTNIEFLRHSRGFDSAITEKADSIHAWLSDYMAHPEALHRFTREVH